MQEIYRFIDDAIEADRQRYTDIADQIWDHPETLVKANRLSPCWENMTPWQV